MMVSGEVEVRAHCPPPPSPLPSPPPACVFTRLDLSPEGSGAPLELVWDCGSEGQQVGVAAPPRRSSTSARHPPLCSHSRAPRIQTHTRLLFSSSSSRRSPELCSLPPWEHSLPPQWWSTTLIRPLVGLPALFCEDVHGLFCSCCPAV